MIIKNYIYIYRHGKTGQNFLAQPNPTRKILDPNSIFFTRSKNGLTHDPLTQTRTILKKKIWVKNKIK